MERGIIMTGRELIIRILSNNFYDKEEEATDENSKPVGFMTVKEAAEKFDAETAMMQSLIDTGLIQSIKLGNTQYIPK